MRHRLSRGLTGRLLGEPLGLTLFSWMAIKIGIAEMPARVMWQQLFSATWLAGIGFTMWVYEMTSALRKAVRFGEITPAEGRHSLALAQILGIQLIPPDIDQVRTAFDWTLRLDRAAAYDSFYLALAETLRCDLWTADRYLRNAVEQSWVRCAADQ